MDLPLFKNDIPNILDLWYLRFNYSNMHSGFDMGSLEKSKLLEQVKSVWFPILICNLILLQI